MGRQALLYGTLLAAGTLALQWIDYRRMARPYSGALDLLLIASGFLALGIAIGMQLIGRPAAQPFDGNPRAQAVLGISPRELEVLREMAAGRSNKEIAIRLQVSPNTVKTHVARLFEKLEANRRTAATNKARALGIIS